MTVSSSTSGAVRERTADDRVDHVIGLSVPRAGRVAVGPDPPAAALAALEPLEARVEVRLGIEQELRRRHDLLAFLQSLDDRHAVAALRPGDDLARGETARRRARRRRGRAHRRGSARCAECCSTSAPRLADEVDVREHVGLDAGRRLVERDARAQRARLHVEFGVDVVDRARARSRPAATGSAPRPACRARASRPATSGTSAMTHRLPSSVIVIAIMSGLSIAPSRASSSVTTPAIGAWNGTRPAARPDFASREAVPASSPSARRRSREASIRSWLPILQRVEVLLLRALEHRRIEREEQLPLAARSPPSRAPKGLRPSLPRAGAPAARGARRTRHSRRLAPRCARLPRTTGSVRTPRLLTRPARCGLHRCLADGPCPSAGRRRRSDAARLRRRLPARHSTERHAADRAVARLVAHDLRVHRTAVLRVRVLECVLGRRVVGGAAHGFARLLLRAGAEHDRQQQRCRPAGPGSGSSFFTCEVIDFVLRQRAIGGEAQVLDAGFGGDATRHHDFVDHRAVGAPGEQRRLDRLVGELAATRPRRNARVRPCACAAFQASTSIACISRRWSSCRSCSPRSSSRAAATSRSWRLSREERQAHRDHRAQHVGARSTCRSDLHVPGGSRSSRRASSPACAFRFATSTAVSRRVDAALVVELRRVLRRAAPRASRAAAARRAQANPRRPRARGARRRRARTRAASGTSPRRGRGRAAARAASRPRARPAARRAACPRPRRSAPAPTAASVRPRSSASASTSRAAPT